MSLRFDDRVAIVTGAGNGLGRSYALLLAQLGAKVVVNDLGNLVSGQGIPNKKSADLVVQQIKNKGGIAIPDYNSVLQGQKIIQTAMKHYGRIDILINNAGIVRDTSFPKMTAADWNMVIDVHLNGTFSCTKAVWNIMRQQKYGRIVNTSSSIGMYGMFGMANYGAAKLGIHGFTNSLAKQGKSKGILVNSIAPYAASRMMEKVLQQDMLDVLGAQLVAPFLAYLVHQKCTQNGSIFQLGGGLVTKVRLQRTNGKFFNKQNMTIDQVAKGMPQICDFSRNNDYPQNSDQILQRIVQQRKSPKAKL